MARGLRKQRTGVVVSNKMDKTAVIELERAFAHPLYKKVLRRSSRLKAHDEDNSAQIGDKVVVVETRPYSKDKHWRIAKTLGKSKVVLHDLPKKSLKELKNEELAKEKMEAEASDSTGN